jgi:hypothetical protein
MTKKSAITRRNASGADVARLAGISRQRANRLLREGRTAGEIILAAELRRGELEENAPISGGKPESFAEARTRKESALADLRQIELGHKRRELIPRAQVEAEFSVAIVETRDALLCLPANLRDQCDGQPAHAIERVLDTELRHILTGFASKAKMTDEQTKRGYALWQEFLEWHKSKGKA